MYNDLTGTFDSTVPPLDPYIITGEILLVT